MRAKESHPMPCTLSVPTQAATTTVDSLDTREEVADVVNTVVRPSEVQVVDSTVNVANVEDPAASLEVVITIDSGKRPRSTTMMGFTRTMM